MLMGAEMSIVEFKTGFGDKLRELRLGRSITQEELASYMHVTRQTISAWERGRHEPDIEGIKRLGVYFNISIDELLSTGGVRMITINYRRGGIFLLPAVTVAIIIAFLAGAPWMALCSIAIFGYVTAITLVVLGKRTKRANRYND